MSRPIKALVMREFTYDEILSRPAGNGGITSSLVSRCQEYEAEIARLRAAMTVVASSPGKDWLNGQLQLAMALDHNEAVEEQNTAADDQWQKRLAEAVDRNEAFEEQNMAAAAAGQCQPLATRIDELRDTTEARAAAKTTCICGLPLGHDRKRRKQPDAAAEPTAYFSLVAYIARQIEWSSRTFGNSFRWKGIVAHICKELCEIEANPSSLEEWCDVIILALDGAWRAGHSPEAIAAGLEQKQFVNFARKFAMPASDEVPGKHDRSSVVSVEAAANQVDNVLAKLAQAYAFKLTVSQRKGDDLGDWKLSLYNDNDSLLRNLRGNAGLWETLVAINTEVLCLNEPPDEG